MVAALALGVATAVNAQGVEVGDGVAITAEVVAIDKVDRTLYNAILDKTFVIWQLI